MVFQSFGRFALGALLLLTLAGASGCQQRVAGKLLGRWVGAPDTAAARAERESLKFGDTTPVGELKSESVTPASATDWESYDLSVTLDFVDHERVEMSLSGGPDAGGPVSGKWRVLSTTPIGCTIEVETESDQSEAVVRRQFQLDFEEHEGQFVGFALMEVGADRQLGMLYFSRPEGM